MLSVYLRSDVVCLSEVMLSVYLRSDVVCLSEV